MARRAQLVTQHLENISRSALKDYQQIIRSYVRGRQGIYALYRRGKLYYVGLASNLRARLNAHLRDRHRQSWDRFSVYLTIGDKHLRELESLLLHIVNPLGNKQRGKFAKSENLVRRFGRDVKACLLDEWREIIGEPSQRKRQRKGRGEAEDEGRAVLAKYVDGSLVLRGEYKGKTYKARVLNTGMVRFEGTLYKSPSGAGRAVRKRNTNGWAFWHYRTRSRKWVPLSRLKIRKRKFRTGKKTKKKTTQREAAAPLAKYVGRVSRIRAKRKGKTIRARVLKDGRISYGGQKYKSPSGASKAVTGRSTDGWAFWKYERAPGDWVSLKLLRC